MAMKLIRRAEAQAKSGLKGVQIYNKMKDPDPDKRFPAPVRIGVRAVAWVESEVDEWIAARIRERDSGAAVAVGGGPGRGRKGPRQGRRMIDEMANGAEPAGVGALLAAAVVGGR